MYNNTVTKKNVSRPDSNVGLNQPSEDPGNHCPPSRDTTEVQRAGGFAMISPNQSARSKMQSIAQKEEEDWNRYREENRLGPLQYNPEIVGGVTEIDEVRQRQQREMNQSKLQKKLKKMEADKKKRQAEEEQLQLMKAKQREKADKLAKKRNQEDEERLHLYQGEQPIKREQFLQKLEGSFPPVAAGKSIPASSGAQSHQFMEAVKPGNTSKEQHRQVMSEEELKKEHRRVNQAFLDRLQAGATDKDEALETQHRGCQLKQEPQEDAVLFPEHKDTYTEEEAGEASNGADLEWTVMKLLSIFPVYEQDFVEDIVSQCDGDFQQAYNLLSQ